MFYAVRYLEPDGTFHTKMPVNAPNPVGAVRAVVGGTDRKLDAVFALATDENGRPQMYSKSDIDDW